MEEDVQLSEEQEFLLARIALEAQHLSKEELVEALLSVWSAKMVQHEIYSAVLAENEISFRMQEHVPIDLSDPDALGRVFGYEPSEEEAVDYVLDIMEGATMELDMDEIVLTPDD